MWRLHGDEETRGWESTEQPRRDSGALPSAEAFCSLLPLCSSSPCSQDPLTRGRKPLETGARLRLISPGPPCCSFPRMSLSVSGSVRILSFNARGPERKLVPADRKSLIRLFFLPAVQYLREDEGSRGRVAGTAREGEKPENRAPPAGLYKICR